MKELEIRVAVLYADRSVGRNRHCRAPVARFSAVPLCTASDSARAGVGKRRGFRWAISN